MSNRHIVIADRDTAFAEEMKSFLEKNGYIVDSVVSDGIDAIAVCSDKAVDVLFIKDDIDFMNGFSVAACLTEKGFCGTIFIVADKYDSDMTAKALDSGADGCIVKPVTEKFLIPWLYTKLTRNEDINRLSKEKEKLLYSLEAKRIIEEANGIIAASSGVSIAEADSILTKKAESGKMSKEQLAKMLISSFTR